MSITCEPISNICDSSSRASECGAALRRLLEIAEHGVSGVVAARHRSFAEWVTIQLLMLRFNGMRGHDAGMNEMRTALSHYGAEVWRAWVRPLLRNHSADWPVDADRADVAAEVFAEFLSSPLGCWPVALTSLSPDDRGATLTPDLLGEAYEYQARDRKARGLFYTPRIDVELMCALSLVAYLDRRCPTIGIQRLAAWLDGASQSRWQEVEAWALMAALHDIRICDPALGAGEFLIAMMRLLGAVYDRLNPSGGAAFRRALIARGLFGCDIDSFAVRIAKLRLWCAALADDAPLSGIPDHLLAGDALMPPVLDELRPARGFDLIIGNPPYLRQERLSGGYDKVALRGYFRIHIGVELSGQADLYMYFVLRGLQLARADGGLVCYIMPNSWLDASYGAALRAAIAETGCLRAVIESRAGRSFARASINTVVALFERGGAGENRFIACARPLGGYHQAGLVARVLGDMAADDPRITRVAAESLQRDTSGWGAWLRAPAIYWRARQRARLVALGTVARIRRGITSGANAFFFVRALEASEADSIMCRAGDGSIHRIERRYLYPAIVSARECAWHVATPAHAPWLLFRCDDARAALAGSGALAYIEWGEARGIQLRATYARRARWWSIAAPADGPVWWPIAHHDRDLALLNQGVAASDNFFILTPTTLSPILLLGFLLSSWVTLQREIVGRTGFGGGLLKTQGPDVRRLLLPAPEHIMPAHVAAIAAAVHELQSAPPLRIWDARDSAPRQALDAAVAAALGMADDAAAIRDAAEALVAERMQRASR